MACITNYHKHDDLNNILQLWKPKISYNFYRIKSCFLWSMALLPFPYSSVLSCLLVSGGSLCFHCGSSKQSRATLFLKTLNLVTHFSPVTMQGDIQRLGIRFWVSLTITTSTVGYTVQCDLFLAVIPFCVILLLRAGKEKGAESGNCIDSVGFNSILSE